MTATEGGIFPAAWAQDDDDGGRDDDGGGGRTDDDGGDNTAPRRNVPPRRVTGVAAPPAVAPLPERAPDEIVVVDLSAEDLGQLVSRGYAVIQTQTTTLVATIAHRLRIPQGTGLEAARDEVRAMPTGGTADFNHYYRTDQGEDPAGDGPQCVGFDLVGWAAASQSPGCGAGARIGLIDTGINPDHETFTGGQLNVLAVVPEDLPASDAQHGTSFAAPFVTVAVAILMANNEVMTIAEVTQAMTGSARDLGAPGHDEVFGAGLVQFGQLCRGVLPTAASSE